MNLKKMFLQTKNQPVLFLPLIQLLNYYMCSVLDISHKTKQQQSLITKFKKIYFRTIYFTFMILNFNFKNSKTTYWFLQQYINKYYFSLKTFSKTLLTKQTFKSHITSTNTYIFFMFNKLFQTNKIFYILNLWLFKKKLPKQQFVNEYKIKSDKSLQYCQRIKHVGKLTSFPSLLVFFS